VRRDSQHTGRVGIALVSRGSAIFSQVFPETPVLETERKSQNHRMAEVGRELQRSSSPTPWLSRVP